MTKTLLLLWKNTPIYQRTFDKIFPILKSKYQYLLKSSIYFFHNKHYQISPATRFNPESCVSWRNRRGMAYNVPRVADVLREGYKDKCLQKSLPERSMWEPHTTESWLKVNFKTIIILFIIYHVWRPNG